MEPKNLLVPTQWTAVLATDTLPYGDGRVERLDASGRILPRHFDYIVWQPPGEERAAEMGYITDKRYVCSIEAGPGPLSEYASCYASARIEATKTCQEYTALDSKLAGLVWSSGANVAVYMGYTIRNKNSYSVLEIASNDAHTVEHRERDNVTTRGVHRDQIWPHLPMATIGARFVYDTPDSFTGGFAQVNATLVQMRYPFCFAGGLARISALNSLAEFRGIHYRPSRVGGTETMYWSAGSSPQLLYLLKGGAGQTLIVAPIGASGWERGHIRKLA